MEAIALKQNMDSKIVTQLRDEVRKNPVFNDVCHVFALRERARQQVTIGSLFSTMKKNGFHHTKEQYKGVIKALAALGFGRLEKDKNNNIVALKNVCITLQSIGRAALGSTGKLEANVPRPKFVDMPQTFIEKPKSAYKVILTVLVEGTPIKIEVPTKVTESNLGELLKAVVGMG